MRRTSLILCASTVVVLAIIIGLVSPADALDWGKLLKRRPVISSSRGGGGEPDVEQKADEVLRYSTACDQQLAKSMVILGEQKGAAEAALVTCREHRETARSDVDFLQEKVDSTAHNLAHADEICGKKLTVAQSDAEAKMQDVRTTLAERSTAMVDLKVENAAELERIALHHETAVQETAERHAKAVENLQKDNREKISAMQKQMEDHERDQLNERKKATDTVDAVQADHEKKMQELEQTWKSAIKSSEKTSKQKVGQVEKNLKTCDGSLQASQRAHESLQRDHDRALQKIAVLEDATVFSLAIEEAKDFAEYTRSEIHAVVAPLYDQHLKEHVDKAKVSIDKMMTVLSPVIQPLKKGVFKLVELQRKFVSSLFLHIKDVFVKKICPLSRAQLKRLQEKQMFESPVFAESIEQACSKPTNFLASVGKVLLVLAVLACRHFIFRTFISLLLLPLRILLFPCTFFFRRSAGKKRPATTKKE